MRKTAARADENDVAERPRGFYEFVRELEAAGDIDPDEASFGLNLAVADPEAAKAP
jgi:hypothetical protein